jgi:hypothetical protein
METEKKKEMEKRPYERPRLRRIELAAEEVLVVGCKSQSGGIAYLNPPPCSAHHCAGPGS